MVVQHNLPAMNSHRQLGINNASTSRNLEKLSSGFRINRAGDDAAGLAISEKMRGQIRGLDMATTNAENGVSLIQTAEGGLNETHAILQRMRELSVQSANGTYMDDVDRENINKEVQALKSEVDRISSSTHYNGIKLLDGTMGGKKTTDATAAASITLMGFAAAGDNVTTNKAELAGQEVTFITKDEKMYAQIGDKTYEFGAGKSTAKEIVDDDGTTLITVSANVTGTGKQNGALRITLAANGSNVALNAAAAKGVVADGKSELVFQIGANGANDQRVGLHVDNMSSANIGTGGTVVPTNLTGNKVTHVDVSNRDKANESIKVLDDAINQVSGTRADLGALQNRLEHTINNLGTSKENLQAAESSIRDVDMAKEMMDFTKNNILVQASQAMLAQSNQLPQGVLQLLR